MGVVELTAELPSFAGDVLRVYVGLTGVLILLTAATTSISGFGRLAYSLGEHDQLPRTFGRLHRRTLVAPQALVAAGAVSAITLVVVDVLREDPVVTLAALYSFGVLVAFGAAQLAVIRLRFTQPGAPATVQGAGRRPGSRTVVLVSVVGFVLTAAVMVVALWTHPGARYAGPIWLAGGVLLYVVVRRRHGERLTQSVVSTDEQTSPRETRYRRILVPMKIGEIGEEMVATAVRLAESAVVVEVLYVTRVPLSRPLEAADAEDDERAAALARRGADPRRRARRGGRGDVVRGRSIGAARHRGCEDHRRRPDPDGLRRRAGVGSRVSSAPRSSSCSGGAARGLVIAFPQGVLEEDGGS